MASWGNQQDNRFPQDMDSNGQKLQVRNSSGTYTESDYRVDIAETSNARKAVRVNGKIQVKQDTTDCGTISPNIDGTTGGELRINAEITGNNRNVVIGDGADMTAGNKVTIMGKHIHIGNTASDFYRVCIGGPVLVGEKLQVPVLQADTETQTPRVEPVPSNTALNLGTRDSSAVNIGRLNMLTTVNGRLNVNGFVDVMQNNLHCDGTITANGELTTHSNLIADGSITAQGDLFVPHGSAHVHGAVSAVGNVISQNTVSGANVTATLAVNAADVNAAHQVVTARVIAHEALVSELAIECEEAASISRNGCHAVVPTTVRTDNDTLPSLLVEHQRATSHEAALRAVNHSTAEDAMGGYFHAPIAIAAEGNVNVQGNAVLNGSLNMREQPIIMGSEGGIEVSMIAGDRRFDFYIGDSLDSILTKKAATTHDCSQCQSNYD